MTNTPNHLPGLTAARTLAAGMRFALEASMDNDSAFDALDEYAEEAGYDTEENQSGNDKYALQISYLQITNTALLIHIQECQKLIRDNRIEIERLNFA